jgi:aspartate-semialdehyde dehydrogenase
MKKKPVVGVIGATGLVGSEVITLLEERKFPLQTLKLFASSDSAGEIYSFLGEEIEIVNVEKNSFHDIDIAIFTTTPDITDLYLKNALHAGSYCVINSSYFKDNYLKKKKDPLSLIIPDINISDITSANKVYASPCCSVVILAPLLHRINAMKKIKRVTIASYQAVSSAGKNALDELWSQGLAIYNQKDFENEAFQHQIAFNCIPQIDVMMDNGDTREEYRIMHETKEILNIPKLQIHATAVRVPVFHCHSFAINIETDEKVIIDDIYKALDDTKLFSIYTSDAEYPMPLNVVGSDLIHVGRVRLDDSVKHGVALWVVADNVRKGSALNAVEIAEALASIL